MPATAYDVVVRYSSTGNLNQPLAQTADLHAKLGSVGSALGNIGGLFQTLGSSMSGIGDSILKVAAGTVAFGAAAVGAVGAFAILKEGILDINKTIEDTQIGLAAIFTGNGEVANFSDGLALAGNMITKMKDDAARLPGTFQDLSHILQTISITGGQAGLDPDQLERLAAQTMTVAKIAGISTAAAGREMAMLLGPEGHTTKTNVLGNRILGGMNSKTFNAKSTDEKTALVRAGLNRIASPDAMEASGKSFEGVSSTFMDHIKNDVIGNSTKGLFNTFKEELAKVNDWFDLNKGKIQDFTIKISDGLVKAFHTGEDFILKWYPLVSHFTDRLYLELKGVWESITPYVTKIGDLLTGFFKSENGPAQLVQGIKSALALAIELKAAGAFMGMAGSAIPLMGSMGSAAAGAMGAGGMAGPIGLGVALAGVAALGVAALGVAGEMHALADLTSRYHDASVTAMSKLTASFEKLNTTVFGTSDAWESIEFLGVTLTNTLNLYVRLIDGWLTPLRLFSDTLVSLGLVKGNEKPAPSQADIDRSMDNGMLALGGLKLMDEHGNRPKPKKDSDPPNHPTIIHKVEIIIDSNQDPSRIARLTMDKLLQVSKNRSGQNFSNSPRK